MTDLLGIAMVGVYALLALLAVRAVVPPAARHPVAACARLVHARPQTGRPGNRPRDHR